LTCRRDAKSRTSIEESARHAQAEAENPRKACTGDAGDCRKQLCCKRFCESRFDRPMRARNEGKSLKALEAHVVDSESFVLARKIFS
jgi:hypothetical protein